MTETVLTYKGKPITDLTKDELVDAMTWAFQEVEYQRERADRLLNAAGLVEPAPEIPTDEELNELFKEIERSWSGQPELDFARAVLARWGNHWSTSLMQSFDKHNQQKLAMFQLNTQPHPNGIACPECQQELMDSNPSVCLTSWPPQYSVHCPSCGYVGTRY